MTRADESRRSGFVLLYRARSHSKIKVVGIKKNNIDEKETDIERELDMERERERQCLTETEKTKREVIMRHIASYLQIYQTEVT